MSDGRFISLLGTEDVQRAGIRMKEAAEQMMRAADQIDHALARHEQFLNDWLTRLSEVNEPPF